MNQKIKKVLKPFVGWIYRPIRDYIVNKKRLKKCELAVTKLVEECTKTTNKARVFYLGITEQPNLGDMAQHFCISKWLDENFPDRAILKYESSVITFEKSNFISVMKQYFKDDDYIVFQSGYCTQDLGGDHPLLHQLIIEAFPNAKILMMPQTIFFKEEKNRKKCADNHNKAANMLFLARDKDSYEMAKEMFQTPRVALFPDIVTTLIGEKQFTNYRSGVCVCARNDGEKFYTDAEIAQLVNKLSADTRVIEKDTQGLVHYEQIRSNLSYYIWNEIESYSHFKVTITDRYHGTIFSLCAGTPVIIIKTTDHKVTTGADWFKGVYDDYVYVAKDLNDAYQQAKKIMNSSKYDNHLSPYFRSHYYDKLKDLFEDNKSK